MGTSGWAKWPEVPVFWLTILNINFNVKLVNFNVCCVSLVPFAVIVEGAPWLH